MDAGRRLGFRALQVLAVGLVLGLLALLAWRIADKGRGSALVGQIKAKKRPQAPGFELGVIWAHAETWPPSLRKTITDGKVVLAELRGYPLVLNFWASWCVPCKAEAPRLIAVARRHAGQVAFLGIDVQDFKSDARRFLGRYGTNYVAVRDGGDRTLDAYGLTGVPETYYLDRQGRIVAHDVGEVSVRDLEAGLAAAVRASTG